MKIISNYSPHSPLCRISLWAFPTFLEMEIPTLVISLEEKDGKREFPSTFPSLHRH